MNPNLLAVANGASAGLILNPDPQFGVLLGVLKHCLSFTLYCASGFGKLQESIVTASPEVAVDRSTNNEHFVKIAVCGEQKDMVSL